MLNKAKKTPFKPILIALANFANGMKFKIEQVKRRGACRVTELNSGQESYSHTIPGAWRSIRYQAKITHKTERSSEV